jgi:hypothetical protein
LAWYTQYDSGSANFSLFLKVSKNTFRIYEQIADTWLGSDTPFHDSPKNWYSDEVFGHMYHRRGEHINNFLNNGQIVSSVK